MLERDVEELDLAAFRFVAGEMTPDEAAGFEKQLAGDQLCEAVCRAVALTDKLVLTKANRDGEETFGSVSASRLPVVFTQVAHPISWMAVGAIAASVAFVIAGRVPSESAVQQPDQRVVNISPPQPSALPSFDANQIDTLAWMEMSDVTRWNIEPVWPAAKQAAPELVSVLETPATIPDWLLETNGEFE